MQNSNKNIWIAVIVVIVVAIIGDLLWKQGMTTDQTSPAATSTIATTSTQITTTKNGITGTGNFTVSGGNEVNITIPDFRAPLKFSADTAADVRTALTAEAKTVEATLAKDSLDLRSWTALGDVRKMGGDYTGAETAWKFVAKSAPNDEVAFANLGDLYQNFLKEYPQAETAYLKVIAINPNNIDAYRSLAILYSNFYKQGTNATENILKKGTAANPDAVELQVLLARYYKSAGRAADATAEYKLAAANATRLGQADTAAQIKAEAGL